MFALSVLLLYICSCSAQYGNDTTQFIQTMASQVESLKLNIKSLPYVDTYFNPSSAYANADSYVFDFPLSANYRVGILMDPCRYNSYDCCLNVFGSPEYPALLVSGLEDERVYKYPVIASPDAVAINYYLVDEDGNSIASSASRSADDSAVYNTTCVSAGDPYDYCEGRNYGFERTSLRPACMDNNSTLDILSGGYAPNGTYYDKYVQIAYTSNTFIPQCGTDAGNHCGTFIELHIAHGSPYEDENTILGEIQITERNVSGYYSTIFPTTYMNNQSKLICSYTESVIRVNSLVYIQATAPICCCPPPYSSTTRLGSFQCPIGSTGDGAFAYRPYTIADTLSVDSLMLSYPFCPIDLSYSSDRYKIVV